MTDEEIKTWLLKTEGIDTEEAIKWVMENPHHNHL
jgi:hypothetical protein